MGTATYYLKANNGTPEKMKQIRKFFLEGCKAEEYWQTNRDHIDDGKRVSFWMPFKKQFPTVSKYLAFIKRLDGDCNNELAGVLDFGCKEDIQENFAFNAEREEIWYYAEVWHFADWDVLIRFLENEYGLKNVRWISDGYIEPFDLL
jgi:hypothetical protein